ncbi:AarF/ABC1/UbiB kinase family protein [Arthrobacter sp. PAMC 25486]|uniref:ABC1 kinase family protein n=1 Tax=Arthrobacter sp. PAMC 25486 TaxID=1494608 RepID=UPI0020A6C6D3|nr:AarF/UbiB family protein [Arthrobacter sp. PAMC 25486]
MMGFLDVALIVLLGIAGLLFLALQSWLAATVVRRVVGVPIGWPRSIAVGFVMSGAMALTVQYLFRAGTDANPTGLDVSPMVALLLLVLAVCWTFALGVGALVFLEAAFPTGTLPGFSQIFTGWKARRRRTRRYADVISIAVRHGLGSRLRGFGRDEGFGQDAKTARALRNALNEAGVTFIKLGQMLSPRRDLLPEVFIRELESLQSNAAPEPWEAIQLAITESLGRPLAEVFSQVDPVPLAAASVAQVHQATLLDGSDVVLKVQRPGALDQVTLDTDIILRLARWLNTTTPWGKSLGVLTLARGFADSLEEELDYRVELDNMRSIEASLAHSGTFAVAVPHAHHELSSERLLVMDRLPGRPVSSAGALLTSLSAGERRALAETLLGATLEQIISDGVFHADLHAGNIFITPEGTLGLLDFGSVGRLDPATQTALGMMLYAIDKNDAAGATDALIELLDRPEDLDERALERSLGQLLTRFRPGFGPGGSQRMFGDLFALVIAHKFAVPAQIGAAFRALAAVEGTLLVIDPSMDLVAAARSEGSRLMDGKLKIGNLKGEFEQRMMQLLPLVNRLPRRLNKITEDLEHGRFSMRVRVLDHPSDRRFLTGLFQQLIVAVLAGSAVLGAILLITSNEGPLLTGDIHLYGFFGFVLLFGGFVLGMRALMLVFKRNAGD